jgi:hypothetical protein
MIKDKKLNEWPYISLYFSALLTVQVRGFFDKKMIRVIKTGINKIDN